MNIYKCPVCGTRLVEKDKSMSCQNGHSFDIASTGYVNLLPGNHRNSKDPGDSKEMMECRRSFLSKGYYSEFSDEINKVVKTYAADNWKAVLDAGCGEGYYIDNLKNELTAEGHFDKIKFYGMDISKHAIKYASKRDKAIRFFIGSSFDIPLMDGTLDCIIRNFAPGDDKEFYRVLNQGGKLMIITPGEQHLFQLKEQLYKKARKHQSIDKKIHGFELIGHMEKEYWIELRDNLDIIKLISMTPYYWSISNITRQNLDKINQLSTQLHFEFDIYEKR